MSSSTATGITESCHQRSRINWALRLWSTALAIAFIIFFFNYLERSVRIATQTNGGGWLQIIGNFARFNLSPDWAHILVIPFFSLYYLYLHRQELAATPRRVYLPGLTVLFMGILSFAFWVYPGRNDMFQGLSMILSLLGLVLFLFGPRTFGLLWFPVLYLLFSVKVADQWWDHFAWKLQAVAAQGGALLLRLAGVFLDMDAEVSGSTINVWNHGIPLQRALDVAQACAGLRSLMAFVALGVAIAFMYRRPWWQRLVLLASTIPIAVLINMARVATIGVLAAKVNPNLAEGTFHTTVGMLMLIPAAGLFLLLGWMMENLVISPASAGHTTITQASAPLLAPVHLATWRWRRSCLGATLGLALAASVGVTYSMLWGLFQPQRIGLTRPSTILVLLVGTLGLTLALVLAARATRPERTGGQPPVVGMGMAAGIFLAASLGLGTMVWASKLVLIKQEIPLRAELRHLPEHMEGWEMLRDTPALEADILQTLGTNAYVMRYYRDTAWTGAQSAQVVILHTAYYTGTPDTVPHVPDRCFVANGRRPVNTRRIEVTLRGERYRAAGDRMWVASSLLGSQLGQPLARIPSLTIPATIFTYQSPERGQQVSNVIYFFVANGRFLATPNEVRKQGFDPRDRYSYYAKVEVELPLIGDQALATQRTSDFLSVAMPEIMSCLPDWQHVQEQSAPAARHLSSVPTPSHLQEH